jgi:hypothetical protein
MGTEVTSMQPVKSFPTATELRRMPKDRRDAIMEEAARIAEELYRTDPSLTDFEAFEAEDPDGDGDGDGEATSEG